MSIEDTYRAEKIINYFKTTRKEQIKAWKKRMGRRCGLVEKCTDLLSEYLEGRRNIERIVFKTVGTIFRGVNNNRFTLEQAEAKLQEGRT